MRTPPVPGGQVSGGREARGRGAPATRTWPGPRPRHRGSCRSAELRPPRQGPPCRPLPGRSGYLPPACWARAGKSPPPPPPPTLCRRPGARLGSTSPGARGDEANSLLGAVSESVFRGTQLAGKEARLPGRFPWDIPRPRVPPRLPACLPLRDQCCPSSLPLVPPSPEAGSARPKISRSFWRQHRSRASLVSEGPCQARGRTSLVRGLGTGPCSFPAERLRRPEVRAGSQLVALWAARAGKSAPVVVAVVTAASLRGDKRL